MERTFSLEQVAERIGVNKMTIYRWEKSKKVPAPKRLLRTNKRIYSERDIEGLISFRDAVIEPSTEGLR